ncbi:Transcriptional regulatory protein DegU [Actinomadura rubteroloni]|uniref:Transcriptional regulatory protein DegU n=1 Tax=Actinomadura rubteroloni TaxID=1926885 RepID=A0A2P4US49_9ACTN|nr:LuxR C-terminal-related transcriptional regulator [Actinomadura rubteroloni]POM27868.1 Transcriptional regulatory protein DegU [Actinomadura rubteroloni]
MEEHVPPAVDRPGQADVIAEVTAALEVIGRTLAALERLLASLENARSTQAGETAAPAESSGTAGRLTRQERRVLDLICAGKSNREISRALGIAEKTAKNHVYSIFRKLGVHSRLEAAFVWTGDRE